MKPALLLALTLGTSAALGQTPAPPPPLPPASPLMQPTTFTSTPFFVHGMKTAKIDASDGVGMSAVVVQVMRKRYIHVGLTLSNKSNSNFDFDPYAAATLSLDSAALEPMSQKAVNSLAKSILRRRGFGGLGVATLGNINADSYSQDSTTNAYEHARSDAQTDGMFNRWNAENHAMKENLLLRSTLAPGDELTGDLYFEIPNADKSPDLASMHMTIRLEGVTYLLKF